MPEVLAVCEQLLNEICLQKNYNNNLVDLLFNRCSKDSDLKVLF